MSPLLIVTMVAPKSTCMTLACQSSFEISVSHRAIFSCSAARMNTIPGIPLHELGMHASGGCSTVCGAWAWLAASRKPGRPDAH